MTRCYVNEREIELPPGIFSLSEALKHVEEAYLRPQSAIRQIKLDNHPFPADEADAIDSVPLMSSSDIEARRLDIATGDLKTVAHHCITEILAELKRIRGVTDSLAKRYSASATPATLDNLNHLREGLCWISLLLEKLAVDFQIDFEAVRIQTPAASEFGSNFSHVLKRFADLVQKRDFGLLAEMIECEINPMIAAWIEIFGLIGRKVRSRA
jgi:hypothetical protein